MDYRAKVNFSGIKLSMSAGEVRALPEDVAKDLLRAGYVEPAEKEKATAKKTTDKKTEKGA